jgi:NAD(P)-dependent dehydrogenase (short-subunit alcohol dehydrogenase family)
MKDNRIFDQWFGLGGKVALVVGASRGLGREIAVALAHAGADVACVARDARKLEETASLIRSIGRSATVFSADVTQEQEVVAMAREVKKAFGGVDILVYSAGILEMKLALETSLSDWHRVCDTNLTGAFLVTREMGKVMKEREGGKIILLSSAFADRILPFVLPYVASKAGVLQLVRNLAYEWARYGIRVNGIAPGYFSTEMPAQALDDPKTRDHILKRIPLRRVGEPAEIGPLAVYLASKASDYMTGEIVRIDGGQSFNIS